MEKLGTDQKKVLRETWALVEKDLLRHGMVMFEKLFTEHPELLPYYSFGQGISSYQELLNTRLEKLQHHAILVLKSLGRAVHALDDPAKVLPSINALGKRHLKYKTKEEMFPIIGGCIVYTLEKGLGELFTAEVRQAWVALYNIMADIIHAAMMSTLNVHSDGIKPANLLTA